MRLADDRRRETGAVVAGADDRDAAVLPAAGLGRLRPADVRPDAQPQPARRSATASIEGRGGFWHVRPWRQVELNDLMALYDLQYAGTTGTVVRSEDYWRWMIGRRYAHVIWVACQGETRPRLRLRQGPQDPRDRHPPGPSAGAEGPARPGPRRGPGAGLSRGDRPRAGRPSRDRGLPRRLGQGRRPGRVRGDVARCTTSPTSSGSSRRSCPS